MAQVRLEKIRKEFRSRGELAVAVDDLELDIEDGEFVSLVGPSGCGKTTTLRILAGLESPTSGRLYFDGIDATNVPAQRRDISMVFQSYAIFPHMTVAQNVGYGLRVARVGRSRREAEVRRAAELVGIADLLGRYPKELSGGQRQRVALARALARTPGLILMDEPLSNLDAKLREETRAELKLLHRRLGNTVVYVTHDQLEAVTLSDRMAVMNHGQVQQFDTPAAIFAEPANQFVAGFIGSPSMNLVRGRVDEGGTAVQVAGEALALPGRLLGQQAGAQVIVGVRPQHARLEAAEQPGTGWRVTVVEPVGTEALVHVTRGAVQLKAIVPAPTPLREDDAVSVRVAPGDVHVFDADGHRIPFQSKRFAPTVARDR